MTAPMPPEWAAVAEKAGRLDDLRPDLIEDTARTFRTAAGQVGDHTAELDSATEGLRDGAWTGHTADEFFGYVGELGTAGQKLGDRLGSVADELSSLGEQLTGVRTSVGDRVEGAKREIQRINSDAAAAAAKAVARQDAVNRQVLGAVPPEKPPEAILAEAAERTSASARAAGSDVDALMSKADDMIGRTRELMNQDTGGAYSAVPSRQAPQPAARRQSGGGAAAPGAPVVTSGGPPATAPPGNVDEWIKEAIKALQAAGVPVTDADIPNIWAIIQHESGGNPNAINNWDSNAAAGHPSKGLMQCIDSTFNAHKLPGHDNIYNPVDNIIAGVQYSIDRYGSVGNVPGIQAMAHGGAYRGY
ncbi:transglycosylase SLT domain-containing protein [Amycolatopsis sp. WQ 127309]|uniref:transglycosylase SLT domain-containing protein n=1 Tax=Amycolatopsis sp. WQ 127309 TaxID=2932773 RepID=UPI001FF54649|nr:transglycosylase SLT domain-containing protein [Amycolatopsis sp. WQ 127309]UOZ06928.1 transglycosylase SLT domain-containing protein [Amycolatopsis sp. WQ 127309]